MVDGAAAGGWWPLRVLGVPGAALGARAVLAVLAAGRAAVDLAPPAQASADLGTRYAPRGVLHDPVARWIRVIAADTGNHRLLVWPDLPAADGADAAIVIGRPDIHSGGPQAGGQDPHRVPGWSRPLAMIAETVAVEGISATSEVDVVLGHRPLDRL